jgi:hypothetical protein
MTLRTEADISRAYCYTTDLAKMLHDYFVLWRRHCNGINDITVPEGKFWVQVLRLKSETVMQVRLVYISKVEHSREYKTPIYDLGASESDGPDGLLYYDEGVNTWYEELLDGLRVDVSVPSLLRSDLEDHLKELRRDHDEQAKETARLKEIEELENRLNQLKN